MYDFDNVTLYAHALIDERIPTHVARVHALINIWGDWVLASTNAPPLELPSKALPTTFSPVPAHPS